MALKKLIVGFALIFGFKAIIIAQTMSMDFSFSEGSGFDNFVRTIHILSDGKIIAGGSFTNFNGVSLNGIARLNVDGSLDTSFHIGTGFDSGVLSTVSQSDGKILVGGYFTSFNGMPMNIMARLNPDGTLDQTFNLSASSGYLLTIEIQSDGKILVGGYFTTTSGAAVKGVGRLHSDGSIDSTFNIGSGFNGGAITLCRQSDGKILAGGSFSSCNGVSCNKIARLNVDGSLDTTFNTGTAFDQTPVLPQVNDIIVQADGKIIVGGQFNSFNGVAASQILRLNPDGTLDTTFNTGTGFDLDVWDINIQNDGRIIVGGGFSNYNGYPINGISRLNVDGSYDPDFIDGTGFEGIVYRSIFNADSTLLIGGDYITYSGIPKKYIAKLSNCSINSIDVTSYVVPSDTILCNGQIALTINGSAPFEVYVDTNTQALICTDYLLLQNQCPGSHALRIFGSCGDSLITQYFIPTPTNYIYVNPFLDSLVQDSIGIVYTNCNINYNSIDTVYIDSLWSNGNIVTVIWNIIDNNGSTLDTVSYVLNSGDGVYCLQINLVCPNKSIDYYFSATEAIYFSNNSVSTAGIHNVSTKDAFRISPNPTNDLVTIHYEGNDVRLRIFNSHGMELEDKKISNGEIVLLTRFESGIYFFELRTSDGMSVMRVVKN